MGALKGQVVFLGVGARIAIVRVSCTQYLDGYILEEMAFGEQLRTCLTPVQVCRIKNGRGRTDTKPLCLVETVVKCGVL